MINKRKNEDLKIKNLTLDLILKTDEKIKNFVANMYHEICRS